MNKLVIIWNTWLVGVLIALGLDVYGSPETSNTFLGTNSLYLSFKTAVVGVLLRISKGFTSYKIKKHFVIATVGTLTLGLTLAIWDYLTPANFVYSLLKINYQNLFLIGLYLTVLCLINLKSTTYKKYWKKIVFGSGIVLSISFMAIGLWPYDILTLFTQEDGVGEWLQVFILIFSTVAALRIALNNWRTRWVRTAYLAGAVACFLAAFEEISWGQRILDLEAPEFLVNINIQKEVNIHNLVDWPLVWAGYAVASAYALFSRFIISRWKTVRKYKDYLFPSWETISFFGVTLGYYILFFITWDSQLANLVEVTELIFYCGVFAFIISRLMVKKA